LVDAAGTDAPTRLADDLARRQHPPFIRGVIGFIGLHSSFLGLLLLFEPRLMMRLFGFPPSVPIFFPSQSGIFLLILGVAYLLALLDPTFVRVILISKAFAVVFLFAHAAFLHAPPIIWGMLAGDSTMLVTLSGALLWYRRRSGVSGFAFSLATAWAAGGSKPYGRARTGL
jgi:hypothetical protein